MPRFGGVSAHGEANKIDAIALGGHHVNDTFVVDLFVQSFGQLV